ncbi:MAG: hypothetical protein LBS64_04140, partial [Spirochaetaceae bacterium]|nr:hypothetical protein [Spirochaetaceae bacterium]
MKTLFRAPCVLFVLFLTAALPAGAQLFNSKLGSDELARINAGEIVMRNLGKAGNISLNPVHPEAKRAMDIIRRLDPAYLAEVIQVRPWEEALIPRMWEILRDIPSYQGIPYWSVRHERYFDLYSAAQILTQRQTDDGVVMDAELLMEPFSLMQARITLRQGGGWLFYQMENKNRMKAEGFTVAKEENLQSLIVVFRHENSLVFYGIGGVDAPVIFFLKSRIETSFMNRIKTFC